MTTFVVLVFIGVLVAMAHFLWKTRADPRTLDEHVNQALGLVNPRLPRARGPEDTAAWQEFIDSEKEN